MSTKLFTAVFGIVVVFIIVMFAFPAISYTKQESMKRNGFHEKQRPSAYFDHDEHNERAELEECETCHHVYKNGRRLKGESSEEMSCSDCHHRKKDFPTRPLTQAYHDLCKGCHGHNKVGPILCGECHARR